MSDTPNFSTDLTGQTAFITGTTSGLGYRFAQVLAASGASVAIAGRRVERLEALAEELRSTGAEVLPVPLDVTDTDALFAAVDHVEKELGPTQILVNNAGKPDAQLALNMDPAFVDEMVATNLTSLFHLASEVTRRLKEAELPGRIVNIASGAAFSAGVGTSWYAITKSAVVRMTEMLALEFARYDVNVNCIAPGAFESEMMDGMLERMGDITAGFPRKRLGKPSQLDGTLLYLVSPSSDFVTGATIRVHDAQGAR
ncbi:MAG: SDR family NAD(P)-dependent oxidoreductase [Acidimicrobiales bacterium]|jgi:NAD(P)-dependent dehydrogenase (short-subunit alcohol dehydrogenase family)|nr:SDR family NAD(P)-dependent oxidoreductase [Acidimicrobiales bacterium]MDP6902656.1 SDR family NAD(P)-dependent oxidoreductase [Acidimicrobiales bacterium]